MSIEPVLVRDFRLGDEAVLRSVFSSSVHELAKNEYSPKQLEAWAPLQYDEAQWAERIRGIQPFVAEIGGSVVGYADLQPSGYIDHFFVAGPYGRRGVGGALMNHIHAAARKRQLLELWAKVSLSAEPFFARHGFIVEARNSVVVRGATLCNARMRKILTAGAEAAS